MEGKNTKHNRLIKNRQILDGTNNNTLLDNVLLRKRASISEMFLDRAKGL